LVLGSLSELIVRSAGGFLKFKTRIQNSRHSFIKKTYTSLFYAYLNRRASYIGLSASFKNEPCFPHDIFGVFISDVAVIGKDCVIFQNVTIGTNTLPDSKGMGSPIIGDNCIIGAGATIVGNVVIGNNCRLGANVTISRNLPPNSIAIAAEPRIIQKNKLENTYYTLNNNRWTFYRNGKYNSVSDETILHKLNNKIKHEPDKSQ
jgi:serine O-acetyltransferase